MKWINQFNKELIFYISCIKLATIQILFVLIRILYKIQYATYNTFFYLFLLFYYSLAEKTCNKNHNQWNRE